MKVVIFLGGFQYGVVNDFAYSIGEVLMQNGIKVKFLDLNKTLTSQDIQATFNESVDFVLSFNGIGCDLRVDNQSLYDYLNIPFVIWLVDHPIYLMSRILEPIKKKVIVCIDDTHVEYIESKPEIKAITTFIPHAAPYKILNFTEENRNLNTVFAGYITTDEDVLNDIKKLHPSLSEIIPYLNQIVKQNGNYDLKELILDLNLLYPKVKELMINNIFIECSIAAVCDKYIRGIKRNKFIYTLLEENICIDFFGNISENHPFKTHTKFKDHGVISFDELEEIFLKAKTVINVMPNFPNGGHERLFSSMIYGAIPITDSNIYTKKVFEKGLVTIDYPNILEAIPNIKKVISDDTYRRELQKYNYEIVQQYHTWINRINELLYVLKEANGYWLSNS
ncbi:MAG: glycosyltransferase [Psychrobacillus sp.]